MTMKLKRIVLLIAVCLQALSLAAAPRIVRPGVKSPTTFAIFIDSRSYEAAAAEVDAYRAAVERDGLGTYLLIDEWQNPESVRSEIIRMTEAQPHLEGVVFVGDIPIAMIRDGQHLTSAFKSSQDRDWKDSSVPSDRYYDDPELQFEFLRRDADEPLYFYYSLSPESRQHIASPIYSARIKPPKREGADSDELLRAYLRKVVKAHAEQNELDNLFVFRGHGYNSEAPEAWAGEQIALREQLPALFRTGSTVRFYDFESRWPMKPYLLEKMARKGVDVALCHHHGAPDTQYLNGYRNGSGMNVSIENIKRFLRSKIDGHKDPEKRKAELIAYYGVPEAWCQLSDSLHTADSLLDQAMDVHIEDLYNRPMNPRMVMFDACYNGSFHLDECIAASYIFGPGDCIVPGQFGQRPAGQMARPLYWTARLRRAHRTVGTPRALPRNTPDRRPDLPFHQPGAARHRPKHGTHGKSIGQQILAPDGRRNDARRRAGHRPAQAGRQRLRQDRRPV